MTEEKILFSAGQTESFWITFLVLLTLLLMFFDSHAYLQSVKPAFGDVFCPIQNVTARVWQTISEEIEQVKHHEKLFDLTKIIEQQKLTNQFLKTQQLQLEQENQELKNLLAWHIKEPVTIKLARILMVGRAPLAHSILVDKGVKQGVQKGTVVLNTQGVLGQIMSVTPTNSEVILLTHPKHALPVIDVRSQVRGIVIGDGINRPLRMIGVTDTADVEKGDHLVTSGLGERFPPGLPVGVVISIVRTTGKQFAEVEVQQNARFERGRFVILLKKSNEHG